MVSYDPGMLEKQSITAFNKIDLIPERPIRAAGIDEADEDICYISAATGENMEILLNNLAGKLFGND